MMDYVLTRSTTTVTYLQACILTSAEPIMLSFLGYCGNVKFLNKIGDIVKDLKSKNPSVMYSQFPFLIIFLFSSKRIFSM